ncbi:MAG TPA: hemerythrin domain-containing protein [Candidatus Avipropionibacterium avicola]|uniref:Hemerythrin domain-containing protein n=1 Tax=Candidatus Avipropionibacterium avicola TaxID=2840701 RepID=A0A9D1GZK7_9ACTN|nr:hemerythrin domain-containing protein [Candidatus Avipropionibacterium avicola]
MSRTHQDRTATHGARENAKPADPVTMALFHAALRRDLRRARRLLESPQLLSRRRARALGRVLLWNTNELRRHHEGEDHHLWPLLMARAPQSRRLLEDMESEHEAIDEPLLRLEVAARGLVADRAEPRAVIRALDDLEAPLLRHLAHEELDAMAIAASVLTHDEWKEFEAKAWAIGYTPAETVRFLTWMCDGVEWSEVITARARPSLAPCCRAVARVLSAVAALGTARLWAGTDAAGIRSWPGRVEHASG